MKKALVALLVLLFVVPMAVAVSLAFAAAGAAAPCDLSAANSSITVVSKLPKSVAGYSGVQLKNAAVIITTADSHDMGPQGALIGLIVAIQESGLRSLANAGEFTYPAGGSSVMTAAQWDELRAKVARSVNMPNDGVASGDWDSIGAFQQRLGLGYGGAGSTDQQIARLLDIAYTAGVFFDRLADVDGWREMAPGAAAQAVQRSAYPDRYAQHWSDAQELLAALGGVKVAAAPTRCTTAISAWPTSIDGWTRPITDYTALSSPFGLRLHPTLGTWRLHEGQDFSAKLDTPIYAAADGIVVKAGYAGDGTGGLYWVVVDHGGGVTTGYLHSEANGILVDVGQHVVAGQKIALVGNSGHSTGPHLHFEVRINGTPIEPLAYLAQMGVTYP